MLTISRKVLYMVLGGMMALVIVGAMAGGTAVFAQDDVAPPTTEEAGPGNGPITVCM